MRRSMLMCLLPVLAAAPLTAQAFEGTITMDMPIGGDAMTSAKIMIKGDKSVSVMTMGQGSGPMAGKEMRVITDHGTGKMTMLIPMEMMGSKGMKMVMDLDKATGGKDAKTEIKPLGTSQSIAGYKCEDYEIWEKGKPSARMCVTHELGTFVYPSSGPMGHKGGGAPSWATAFGGKDGGFPLKVWGLDGKTIVEVTSVHKGSVPSDAFTIPDGYMDMPGMGGGRGGGQ